MRTFSGENGDRNLCTRTVFKKDESKRGKSRKHFTLNKNLKREIAINTREKIIRNSVCLNSFNGFSPLLDAIFLFFLVIIISSCIENNFVNF